MERERAFEQLQAHPGVHFAVTVVSNARIDDINILQASLEAMAKSVSRLRARGHPVDYALIDGNRMPKWCVSQWRSGEGDSEWVSKWGGGSSDGCTNHPCLLCVGGRGSSGGRWRRRR